MPRLEFRQYATGPTIPVIWDLDAKGLSDESKQVVNGTMRVFIHYHIPMTRETVAQKFRALTDQWQEETAHLSSPTRIAMHPAYQQIIGMGPAVIPLILRDLANNPKQWFWALTAITGINPIIPSEQGRVKKMINSWINWGKEKGYI